jgi:hypothetical protein
MGNRQWERTALCFAHHPEQQSVDRVLYRRPFKNPSGKAQKKFKADEYLQYVRVWTFCSNAARGGISTAC